MTIGTAAGGLVLGAVLATAAIGTTRVGPSPDAPRFTGGALVQPAGYDQWPLAGASLGLSYAAGTPAGSRTFHRVYVNPASYRTYLERGVFPQGTTFVLELYEAASQLVLPARSGQYEGQRVAVEASVKDSIRFPEGWAYFDFDNGRARAATPFAPSRCQSCHRRHAAVDHVFTQFYPRLRDVGRRRN